MDPLKAAAIGVLIISAMGVFVLWIQKLYITQASRNRAKWKRNDVYLMLMLIMAALISMPLSLGIHAHIEKYPKSVLTIPVDFFGRLNGAGCHVYVGDKFDLVKGIFLFPFLVLAVICFVIWGKCFKGRIEELQSSPEQIESGLRIKRLTISILAILAVLAIIMMTFFPGSVVRFCDFVEQLSRNK